MITTQKEKVFAGELKELMKKHGVRIEAEESFVPGTDEIEMVGHKFVGPDIDITIEEFELWRSISHDTNRGKSISNDTNIAA